MYAKIVNWTNFYGFASPSPHADKAGAAQYIPLRTHGDWSPPTYERVGPSRRRDRKQERQNRRRGRR